MFRMYNHVSEGSEIRGWGVQTQPVPNRPDRKHHNICLSGVEKGTRLAIDRNNYEDLTIVDAGKVFPNINTFTKLYSIYIGADKYLPIVSKADTVEENRNILLFNYETNPGEVIADIQFNNLLPISHYISNKDFKSRITIAAIDIDNTKDFGIKLKYGFNGGRILEVEEINFTNYLTLLDGTNSKKEVEFFNIYNSHETVERIEAVRLNIPRMDLSDICINPQ